MLPSQFELIKQQTKEAADLLEHGNFDKATLLLSRRQKLLEEVNKLINDNDENTLLKNEFIRLIQWIQVEDASAIDDAQSLRKGYQAKMVTQVKTNNALKQYKNNLG